MTELTPTQKTILEAAIGHLNGSIHPLPEHLKGGAAKKVIKSMLKNGLIEEVGPDSWRITEIGFLAIGLRPPQGYATVDTTQDDDPEIEEDLAIAEEAMAEVVTTSECEPDTDMEEDVAIAEASWEALEPDSEPQPAFVDEPDPDYWAIALKQFPKLTRTEWPPLRNIIEEAFMLGFNHAKSTRQPKMPRQPRADSKQAKVLEMMRRPEGATLAQITEETKWMPHTIRAFISTVKKKGMGIATNQVRMVGSNQQGAPVSTTTYFVG